MASATTERKNGKAEKAAQTAQEVAELVNPTNGGHGTASNPVNGLLKPDPSAPNNIGAVESLAGMESVLMGADVKPTNREGAFYNAWKEYSAQVDGVEDTLRKCNRFTGNHLQAMYTAISRAPRNPEQTGNKPALDFGAESVRAVWEELGEQANYVEDLFAHLRNLPTPPKEWLATHTRNAGRIVNFVVSPDNFKPTDGDSYLWNVAKGSNVGKAETYTQRLAPSIVTDVARHLGERLPMYLKLMGIVGEIKARIKSRTEVATLGPKQVESLKGFTENPTIIEHVTLDQDGNIVTAE